MYRSSEKIVFPLEWPPAFNLNGKNLQHHLPVALNVLVSVSVLLHLIIDD